MRRPVASPPPSFRVLLALVSLCLTTVIRGHAHDSPEHEVERIDTLMARRGRTAELLLDRVAELRELGRRDEAVTNLLEVIRNSPASARAHAELGRVYLSLNRPEDARATVTRGLAAAIPEEDRPVLHMIRAEAYHNLKQPRQALADCERAFARPTTDIDWYLIRSRIQSGLERWNEAAAGLREGFDRTGSAVLAAQWVEALVDAGRCREAIAYVDTQLPQCRWQSSWLLRRARARLGVGESTGAQADLRAAVRELDQRIRSAQPDLTLVADRGFARALLGDEEGARNDLAQAQQLGADNWVVGRLARYLGSSASTRTGR